MVTHRAARGRCSLRSFIAGVLLLLPACQGRDDTAQQLREPAPGNATELHSGALPAPPDTPVGRQLAWIIEVVNRDPAQLEPGEIEEHFAEDFLRFRRHEEIAEMFASTAREDGPLTFVEVSPDTDEQSALALVEGNRSQLTIGVNVAGIGGKITGLQFLALAALEP